MKNVYYIFKYKLYCEFVIQIFFGLIYFGKERLLQIRVFDRKNFFCFCYIYCQLTAFTDRSTDQLENVKLLF